MATAKKKEVAQVIEVRPVELETVTIKIVGDSPLITHCWSAKAKRQIIEKEIGATKAAAREVRNPLEDFASSMYWLTPMPEEFTQDSIEKALTSGARFGFPTTAIKQSAIAAAYRSGWSKNMVTLQGTFFIKSDFHAYYAGDLDVDYDKKKVEIIPNVLKPSELLEIHSDMPVMREDPVKVGQGSADLRYRGEFQNWWVTFDLTYNKNGMFAAADSSMRPVTLDFIVNMINLGGFSCGIGEWRTEKSGVSGSFHVEQA